MRYKFISRENNNRLILIYAGWGMDWRVFRHMRRHGYDIIIVWDYRQLTFDWSVVASYDEICLVAWSMGVFAASVTIHEILPRITKSIAVGGTPDPISDTLGIPVEIYRGTAEGLNAGNLRKFHRRMCLDAGHYSAFREVAPRRDISSLRDELYALETHTIFHAPQVCRWDLAIIGRHDRIFPPANQMRAWRDKAPTVITEGAHLPDMQSIIDDYIVDKDTMATRFAAAAETYNEASVQVQQKIAQALYKILKNAADVDALCGDILEIGCGTGTLTRLYADECAPASRIELWDIAHTDAAAYYDNAVSRCCDAEVAIRRRQPRSAYFILSSSTIQWFNSPTSFLEQCTRVLLPGGYIAFSTFVRGNLPELLETCPKLDRHLPTANEWRAMLPSALEPLICQPSVVTITMDSTRDVLEHLRRTGVNALAHGTDAVTMARRILRHYPRHEDGSYTLTYYPLIIVARKIDPTIKDLGE